MSLNFATIENSVKYIGRGAFDETPWYNNQPDGLVYAGNVAYKYKGEMPTNTQICIKEGTLGIASHAFYGYNELISVSIPNSLTTIGEFAFYECSSLTSISIPNSVTTIGISAFLFTPWYNNKPDGLVYAGKVAYKYKGEMPANSQIIIEDGCIEIAANAFSGCKGLTSVSIPPSVNYIGDSAFHGCSGLTTITIPNSVISIGSDAFYGCSGLARIVIPNSMISIGNGTFDWCDALTDVYCYAKTVPKLLYRYYGPNVMNATLHVPAETIVLYKYSWPWNSFGSIVALSDNDPKPTGIENIISSKAIEDSYFTINGYKILPIHKGIYIHNGKKEIVK